jgi:hypothetical protein
MRTRVQEDTEKKREKARADQEMQEVGWRSALDVLGAC